MRLFRKKKEISEIEMEIRKYPRKQRKRLREMYARYEKGQILQPGEDIDNKKFIMDKE